MLQRVRQHLRTLRWSTWLGWQVESSWTDPWLFLIYVVAKPLAGVLILLFMFVAARGVTGEMFHYVYVSNACYLLVGAIMFGMSWAVISDREHYGMLKYLYLSPMRLRSYLVGRGLAGGVKAGLGAILALLLGRLLGVPLHWGTVSWPWLVIFLGLGLVMLASLGLIIAGAVLNMARHGYFLSEGIAGTIYLFSGAIFPVDILPRGLQPISLILPPTYWLEGMRRALLGPGYLGSARFADLSESELALMLTLGTCVLFLVANLFFSWCERRAWKKGKFEETTGY